MPEYIDINNSRDFIRYRDRKYLRIKCGSMSIKRYFMTSDEFKANIGTWDMSQCTDMHYMFSGYDLTGVDLSGWNTSACMTMQGLFKGALNVPAGISAWDVSACRNMSYMFRNCDKIPAGISAWDPRELYCVRGIFAGSDSNMPDISSWDLSKCRDTDEIYEVKHYEHVCTEKCKGDISCSWGSHGLPHNDSDTSDEYGCDMGDGSLF